MVLGQARQVAVRRSAWLAAAIANARVQKNHNRVLAWLANRSRARVIFPQYASSHSFNQGHAYFPDGKWSIASEPSVAQTCQAGRSRSAATLSFVSGPGSAADCAGATSHDRLMRVGLLEGSVPGPRKRWVRGNIYNPHGSGLNDGAVASPRRSIRRRSNQPFRPGTGQFRSRSPPQYHTRLVVIVLVTQESWPSKTAPEWALCTAKDPTRFLSYGYEATTTGPHTDRAITRRGSPMTAATTSPDHATDGQSGLSNAYDRPRGASRHRPTEWAFPRHSPTKPA